MDQDIRRDMREWIAGSQQVPPKDSTRDLLVQMREFLREIPPYPGDASGVPGRQAGRMVRDTIERVFDTTIRQTLWVMPSSEAVDHCPALWAIMERLRSRGVDVKVLFPSVSAAAQYPYDKSQARVAALTVNDLIIIDDRSVLLRPHADLHRDITVLHEPESAIQLQRRLRDIWDWAVPADQAAQLLARIQHPITRRVLARLNEGDIDEVAARELGISVRTYRRHIADLMRDLNARSRFQIGALTASLRLLGQSYAT